MDYLWAPWRLQYVKSADKGECIFCEKPKKKNLKKEFILKKSTHTFSLLNLYPYTNGHLMVSPYRHVASITQLKKNELNDFILHIAQMEQLLKSVLSPDGFNIGLNVSRVAGSGFDEHVHMHIVPRWNGDTNFMPVISNTKVIPDSLENMYEVLMKKLKRG